MRLLRHGLCAVLLCAGGALAEPPGDDPPQEETAPVGAESSEASLSPPSSDVQAAPEGREIVVPVLVEELRVEHPLPAEEARVLGPARVVVLLTVGVNGGVSDFSVVEEASHPDARLRQAALTTAQRARFQPATRAGEPLVVRLPLEIEFQPPPEPEVPMLDGVTLQTAYDLDEQRAVRPLDPVALGQSLAVGGGLVLGASLLFTTFSGVTALDNATRQEELAKTSEETAAAEQSRAFGTMMLIPFAGPFLAIPSSPNASTTLFAALGGVAHVAGAALVATGGALMLAPLFLESGVAVEHAE